MDGAVDGWVDKWVRGFYESWIFPNLTASQRVILVPGSFGSDVNHFPNGTFVCDRDCYDDMVAHDARDFYAWATTDARVAGVFPWNWGGCAACNGSRWTPPHTCCMDELGTAVMPKSAAAWETLFGAWRPVWAGSRVQRRARLGRRARGSSGSTAAPLPPFLPPGAPLQGSLFYGTCNLPACDTLEFASYDLATGESTDLFDFPLDSFDDRYVADSALYNDTVVISLQYDSAPDVGYLATFSLSSNRVISGRNSTPCFGLWPDVDAPATTLLCLALVPATAKCPPTTTSQCTQLLRIDRATGAETLLASLLPDYAPFTVEALDAAKGVIYSTFELLNGGTPELVTLNARTGAVMSTTPYPYTLAFLEFEVSAARGGKVFAVVQDGAHPGGTVAYAGVVDTATATATPLGPKSFFNVSFPPATGGFFNQFNTISTLSDELGVFFSTAFHYEIPSPPADPILHLIGNSLDNGALVFDEVVKNPFCEILWIPTA